MAITQITPNFVLILITIFQEYAAKLGRQPSLWRVYFKVHGPMMLASFFVKILTDLCSFVGPLALDPIVVYVTSGSQEVGFLS